MTEYSDRALRSHIAGLERTTNSYFKKKAAAHGETLADMIDRLFPPGVKVVADCRPNAIFMGYVLPRQKGQQNDQVLVDIGGAGCLWPLLFHWTELEKREGSE